MEPSVNHVTDICHGHVNFILFIRTRYDELTQTDLEKANSTVESYTASWIVLMIIKTKWQLHQKP